MSNISLKVTLSAFKIYCESDVFNVDVK